MIPADRPLKGTPYAVLDYETTGIDARTCWPVQAAVVHGVLGEDEPPTVALQTLVCPPEDVEIPEEAARIHGKRRPDLVGAPSVQEATPAILDALKGRLLVCFNLPYDWQVLATSCARSDLRDLPPFVGLDPLVWARRASDKFSNKLTQVADRYGIDLSNAHDAGADAMGTALVMRPLLRDYLLVLRKDWGEETWRKRRPLAVGSFLDVQREVALVGEAQMSRWFKSKGKPWADHPWHELTHTSLPMDLRPREATPGRCKSCGAATIECEAPDGRIIPLDPDTFEGVVVSTPRDLRGVPSEVLRLEDGSVARVHFFDVGHELQPGDREVKGRTSHWFTCPNRARTSGRRSA